MKFRTLLCGHDPHDPAEATLVLAAAAAFNGLLATGEPMSHGRCGRLPTRAELAEELGLHIGAVRRGVQRLQKVGAIRFELGGIAVVPEELGRRWGNPRQRIRITADARKLGMRARPLLLTALVTGQQDKQGRLMLGVNYLRERTGLHQRTVERALSAARDAGAIHTWARFTRGSGFRQQLWIALGPSRSGGSNTSQSGGSDDHQREPPALQNPKPSREASQSGGHPVAKRRSPHRETAVTPSQSGGRHPDLHPEYLPDHHPERADARGRTDGDTDAEHSNAPAAPRVEPTAAPAQPSASPRPADPEHQQQVVEKWVTAFVGKGVERMGSEHAPDVAGLLDRFGPPPPDVIGPRLRGLLRERLQLAERVIAWCPSPERLGRWLMRVARWYGVRNVGAYLRQASSKGDPGTVLNRRPADEHDFTRQTEHQLEGAYADDVARLVAGGAAVLATTNGVERARLRDQLRELLSAGQPVAARTVLLKLLGTERSDIGIIRAVGGACTLDQAKELLAA